MFQSLTAIIEQLNTLAEASEKRRHLVFERLVSPLFESLKPIARDYVSLIRDARKAIVRGSDSDLHEIAERLEEQRNVFAAERQELRDSAIAFATNIKDHEVARFAADIVDFFTGNEDASNNIQGFVDDTIYLRKSPSASLVDKIAYARLSCDDNAELVRDIDELLVFLERKWHSIAYRFGPIELKALAPRGTLRRRWWQIWR